MSQGITQPDTTNSAEFSPSELLAEPKSCCNDCYPSQTRTLAVRFDIPANQSLLNSLRHLAEVSENNGLVIKAVEVYNY